MKIKIPGHEIEIDKDDKAFLSKISQTDFIGLIGGDWIRYWRWKNLLAIVEKVKNQCNQEGNDPQKIAPKFLQEYFEQASLEEDPSLQELWASLLTSQSKGSHVNFHYINILKNLERIEAEILLEIRNEITRQNVEDLQISSSAIANHKLSDNQFDTIIEKLYSFRLLKPGALKSIRANGSNPVLNTTKVVSMTAMGRDFCEKVSR
jgi:hypothetical protein